MTAETRQILTIAGSDSSGGAGIQADIKTITTHNCYAASVITAVTAQNTVGVQAVQSMEAELVEKQLQSVFEDLTVHGVKIGMVSDARLVEVIAQALETYRPRHVVIDPVMISQTGYKLMPDELINHLKSRLLPLAGVITPNHQEALVLSGGNEANSQTMASELANEIRTSVLITGGHDPDRKNATDTLYNYASGNLESFSQSYVDTLNTHGTGCTLSSAIACNLASGLTLQESAHAAQNYIAQLLNWSRDIKVGQGQGPLPHHLFSLGH